MQLDDFKKYIDLMRDRCEAVIAANGGHTDLMKCEYSLLRTGIDRGVHPVRLEISRGVEQGSFVVELAPVHLTYELPGGFYTRNFAFLHTLTIKLKIRDSTSFVSAVSTLDGALN